MFAGAVESSWERTVPVLLRCGGEETRQELSLRLALSAGAAPGGRVRGDSRRLVGARLTSHSLFQVLRLVATSEADPHFLHTLSLSEDDFGGLRLEQGILVDFATFPSKVAELLGLVVASQADAAPRCGCCAPPRAPTRSRARALARAPPPPR
jgi:hypothetical protein